MKYIIDGYNLTGKLRSIDLSDNEKEEKLRLFIKKRIKRPRDRFTLVFDGKNEMEIFGSHYQEGEFDIVFTNPEESADEYIFRLIDDVTDKSSVVVVSSDRGVINYVKEKRIKTQKCEDFIKYLCSRDINKYQYKYIK